MGRAFVFLQLIVYVQLAVSRGLPIDAALLIVI